jgi:hypothetical protein
VRQVLAAEVGEEPQEERKADAKEETGDDGEIERCVFAAVDDVAGEASQAEREFGAEIEKCAEGDEEEAEEEERAAEFAERVHERDSRGNEVKK